MCFDPVTMAIVGGTMMLAGTGTQALGQRQAQDATTRAYLAESERQQQLANQAYGIFNQSADAASAPKVNADMAARAGERATAYTNAVGHAAPAVLPNQSTIGAGPRIMQNATRAEAVSRGGFMDRVIEAMSKLKSFGDASANLGYGLDKNRLDIGVLQDAGRGSMRALQTEVAAAQGKGRGLRALGDLLVGGGQLAIANPFGGGGASPAHVAGPGHPSTFSPLSIFGGPR